MMLPADFDLFDHQYGPAKDNVLLVGDAGAFTIPFTVEGVGAALKSGSLAAAAVLEAVKLGRTADVIYASKIKSVVQLLRRLRSQERKMKDAAAQGAEGLALAIAEYIEESFYICNT